MENQLRETVLQAVEECLDAQLRAVRRLRKAGGEPPPPRRKVRMSQVDMAYAMGGGTLPVTDATLILVFGVRVTREVRYSIMVAR